MSLQPFTFVLERLGQLLIDEIKFLSTDKKKLLANLKEQVELAQSFVRDVEEENQQVTISHVLETEVQHIMKILPHIEDFLDTLYLEDVQQSQQQISCFPKFMACFSYTSNPLFHRHLILDKAIHLSDDLRATRQRAEPYHRQSNCPQLTQRRRLQTRPNIIKDQFIVGLEEDVKTLVAKLVGKEGEPATTLAIVGMGGAGKTTLARKLYNHQEITRRFTSRAWACVSQEWNAPQILCEICAQLRIKIEEGETSIAGAKLAEFLERNSCFIVLDDVWKKEALQDFLPVLCVGGGRVLITTRNKKVVKFHSLGHFHVHEARRLTEEESWDLFSIIIHNGWQGVGSFQDEGEFARLGKKMLRRCKGLPFAIVALAGLLSAKATIQEWEITKNNVISRLVIHDSGSHDYVAVKEMLELSYSDLPYDLKTCFLYLGVFKDDSKINVGELIQLWIGEGLLRTNQHNECETLEEFAMNSLDELVERNMVQAVSRDAEGKVENIQVHDLVREFCIAKAKDLSFFELSSPSTLPSNSKESMPYRAVIHSGELHSICNQRLRSVLQISNNYECTVRLKLAYKKMKLLKVLHLTRVDLKYSAEGLENLILLRYLEIDMCDGITDKLLESIKRLRNLLTLTCNDIYTDSKIPNNIVGSMEQLRHLQLWGSKWECPMLGVNRTKSLQYLCSVAGEWLTKELHVDSMLDSLRELSLNKIRIQEHLEAIYEFVSNPSNHLNVLGLYLEDGLEFELQRMNLRCCRLLKTLELRGKIRNQAEPLFFAPNLLDLRLCHSEMEEKALERALPQLHQLSRLQLQGRSYQGDKLTTAGLPQLQLFVLHGLENLTEWRIEEGALSQLKELKISCCSQLKRIPEEISDIRTLQYLELDSMPESFCERILPPPDQKDCAEGSGAGKDIHLIRHIPNIHIRNTLQRIREHAQVIRAAKLFKLKLADEP